MIKKLILEENVFFNPILEMNIILSESEEVKILVIMWYVWYCSTFGFHCIDTVWWSALAAVLVIASSCKKKLHS